MTSIAPSDADAVARTTSALDSGALVVVPGDLRYVVAADALADDAIERLLLATQRGADRGLTVLIGGYEDLHHVAFGSSAVRALADAHWPGPTTFAVRARPWLPDAVTGAREEVAVCVPAHPFTRAVAKRFGPMVVASARRMGGVEPCDVEVARRALGAEAALYVDGGPLPGGAAKVIRGGEVAPE